MWYIEMALESLVPILSSIGSNTGAILLTHMFEAA